MKQFLDNTTRRFEYLRNRRHHYFRRLTNIIAHPFSKSNDFDLKSFNNNYQIRYINLQSAQNRRKFMTDQFESLGLSVERIDAIRVTEDTLQRDYASYLTRGTEEYLDSPAGRRRKLGIIGCYLSHLKGIEQLSPEFEYGITLEDDIFITPKLFYSIDETVKYMDRPWDILAFDSNGKWKESDRVEKSLYYPKSEYPYYYGTYAYAIRVESKNKILNALKQVPITDFDTLLFRNSTEIDTLIARTGLLKLNKQFKSDISPQ